MPTSGARLPVLQIVAVTIAYQLAVYAVPAVAAWTGWFNVFTLYLPFVALPVSLGVGVVMLLVPGQRRTGAWVVVGTVLAAVLEIVLTFALVALYSDLHPGWDLS